MLQMIGYSEMINNALTVIGDVQRFRVCTVANRCYFDWLISTINDFTCLVLNLL